MKAFFLITCILFALIVRSANVEWDFIHDSRFSSHDGETILERGFEDGLQVSLFFWTASATGSGKVTIYDATCNLATEITWLPVFEEGVAVDSSMFGDGKTSLYSSVYKESGGGTMDVDVGRLFYLAFQAYELLCISDPEHGDGISRGRDYYGWVALSAKDGDAVELLSSAINLSGGGIIVGAGAVPEPSGGALLALGMSLLALRRKREA